MVVGCYIQVILPLRLAWIPCYWNDFPLPEGQKVTVPLAGRQYIGVVWKSCVTPEIEPGRVQCIIRVNSELSPVSAEELRFWEFLSNYYLCTIGEVYKAAYPSGKTKSEQTGANILARLKARLAIRDEALQKKHKDNVRQRLEAERSSIAAQIAALTRIPGRNPVKQTPPQPLLIVGGNRTGRYISLCRGIVEQGLNALILLPEIAASEQLEAVFESEFPGVTHIVNSHITETRRRRIAEDVRSFGGQIVIGTRSALFLPLSRLGLVIVDQEQDVYFKQTDPAPRYNARDAAVMLARIHRASAVLGTPAPSLESLHNAQTGKYTLEETSAPLPPMTLIDINAERRKNGMPGRLSLKLIDSIRATDGPVALIRGWEKPDELLSEAAAALPGRSIDILTLQEARLKDLGGYALIAVVQADALGGADSFRADEHALQALALLREACKGTFIVQTAKPEHPVFGEPHQTYAQLLQERREFSLPPFTRIVDTVCGTRKERYTLPSDGTLAARKQEIFNRALAQEKSSRGKLRTTIDVDPIV